MSAPGFADSSVLSDVEVEDVETDTLTRLNKYCGMKIRKIAE